METAEITKAFFRANLESLGSLNFYETKEGKIIPLKMIIDIAKIDSSDEYQIQYASINISGLIGIEYYIIDEDEYNIIKYLMNVIDYNKACNMREDYTKTHNIIKGII